MLLYLNQPIKINFNIGLDTNLTSSIVLRYRKPNGDTGEFTNIQILDASSGSCFYNVLNNELDELGAWSLWSYIETAEGFFPGSPMNITVRAEGGGIVSRETAKAYLGITDTTYDTKIDLLIPVVEQTYLDIRNVPFETDPTGEVTVYPAGSDITASEMIGYKLSTSTFSMSTPFGVGKASESIDSYSVSYTGNASADMFNGYPKGIVSGIVRYIDGR